MIPKEKAQELVEKYLNTIIHFPYIDTEDGNCIGTGYMTHNSAVRCAINAVDEILNSRPVITDSQVEYNNYWQQVKQEIEKL